MPRSPAQKKRKTAVETSNHEDSPTPKKKLSSANAKEMQAKDQSDLMQNLTNAEWKSALQPEVDKNYFKNLEAELAKEFKSGAEIFPPKELIFNALNLTPLSEVKVVLLGQDPYHDDGQAMGLAFSVPEGVKITPSLRNMFTELTSDIQGFTAPENGSLEKWAKQGVLLLNATLTVRAHNANSHSKLGWQTFTDSIIKLVSDKCDGVVFMLWGNFAHKKEKLVNATKHTVLKDAHPSPLSFGKFKGCRCFSRANQALKALRKKEIDWKL